MKKHRFLSMVYLLAWLLLLVFMRFRWDILIGRPGIAGTLTTLFCGLVGLGLLIFAVVYAVCGLRGRSWRHGIPLLICGCCLFYSFCFAFTPLCGRINQSLYRTQREQVIDIYNRGELQQHQIGETRYLPPQRLASYDGAIDVYGEEEDAVIFFRTFIGAGKNAALLYVANGDFKPEQFVGGQIQNYCQLDDHWIYGVYRTLPIQPAKD